ncbi:DUF4445 domain-containing protein [Candidatus Sumerlaeota bacterium]|nr:DUF4445 domain-containing protein [Candidatus Sumerlaeota bacterium]
MPFQLIISPGDRRVSAVTPTALSDLAADVDVVIDHPCGSRATCGKCRVRFTAGAPEPTEAERALLSSEELASGWRLSCQCTVAGDAEVEIPDASLIRGLKTFGPDDLFAGGFEPQVRRHRITLPPEGSDEQITLLSEIRRAIRWPRPLSASMGALRALPEVASESAGRLTVTLDGDNLVVLHTGHSGSPPLGVAVDLGSTTVAAAMVNLATGHVLASADALNPQVRFGADVITRVHHAQGQPGGNRDLHRAAVEVISDLIGDLSGKCEVSPDRVVAMTVAGNPIMLHTLLGVDVRSFGMAPYMGVWTEATAIRASELGLPICPTAWVRLFPMVRSNVGGDTVAAAVAMGLDQAEELTLLIDLGTNSEIVIGQRDRAIATSTAAGPAFEGATISQGMRAASGAIDRVSLGADGDLRVHVIGGSRARGICGTGLIDAVAALRTAGVVDESGRMIRMEEVESLRSAAIRSRMHFAGDGHPSVTLATAEDGHGGVAVRITDRDVRQLQLVKGSIQAGAEILLGRWGAQWGDVTGVFIAGAFGAHVRKVSAIALGLLPPVDPESVELVGDAAGIGARMALVDRFAWDRAIAFARRCEHLELGFLPEYQAAFAEGMRFPALPTSERGES